MKEGTYNYAFPGFPSSHGPLAPVLGDGQTSSLLSDIHPYSYYPQINAEARNHILYDALPIVN